MQQPDKKHGCDLEYVRKRKTALLNERSSWDAPAREYSQYFLPRAGRFSVSERNQGDKRYSKIYDPTSIRCPRVLSAGMVAGISSPARPWFRLATPDPGLMQYDPVKEWLGRVEHVMRMIFARSNLYTTFHKMYEELSVFGTACGYIIPDFNSIVHSHCFTWGEYALAQDDRGNVDTMVREYGSTVGALVKEFGYDRCSISVQNAYNNGNRDRTVTVTHFVSPRNERKPGSPLNTQMAYQSVYFEDGERTPLRYSGMKRFRCVAPRWATSGGDVYGTGCGAEGLGMAKQLQLKALRNAQAIDYQTRPPLQIPASMKSSQVNTLPGGSSFLDMANNQKIQPVFESRLDLTALGMDIADGRRQLEQTFYVDLFLMLANDTRSNVTAREIVERHEEKMLMIGSVLERLHKEMLEPSIDLVFDEAMSAVVNGQPLIPPPPPELDEMDLSVDFISVMAQAQKMVGLQSIERYATFAANLAQIKPEAVDKLNVDGALDAYADMLGVDQQVQTPDDVVIAVREQRQAEMEQQKQMAMAASMAKPIADGAKAVQTLGAAHSEDGSALDAIMQQLTGMGAPQ